MGDGGKLSRLGREERGDQEGEDETPGEKGGGGGGENAEERIAEEDPDGEDFQEQRVARKEKRCL